MALSDRSKFLRRIAREHGRDVLLYFRMATGQAAPLETVDEEDRAAAEATAVRKARAAWRAALASQEGAL